MRPPLTQFPIVVPTYLIFLHFTCSCGICVCCLDYCNSNYIFCVMLFLASTKICKRSEPSLCMPTYCQRINNCWYCTLQSWPSSTNLSTKYSRFFQSGLQSYVVNCWYIIRRFEVLSHWLFCVLTYKILSLPTMNKFLTEMKAVIN